MSVVAGGMNLMCVGRLEHSLSRKNVGKSSLAKKLCLSLGNGLVRLFTGCKPHLQHRKTHQSLKNCYAYLMTFKKLENKTEVHREVEEILIVAAVDAAQVQLNYITSEATKRNEKLIAEMQRVREEQIAVQQRKRAESRSGAASTHSVTPAIDLSPLQAETASSGAMSQLPEIDAPLPRGVKPPDVEGWDTVEDESGYWYYLNPTTGAAHWPDELATAIVAESAPPVVQEEPPRVKGWKTVLDSSGYWCYISKKRGTAVWPEDIEEAAAEEIAISALERHSSKEEARLAAEQAEADRKKEERWRQVEKARLARQRMASKKAADVVEALNAAKCAQMEEEKAKHLGEETQFLHGVHQLKVIRHAPTKGRHP